MVVPFRRLYAALVGLTCGRSRSGARAALVRGVPWRRRPPRSCYQRTRDPRPVDTDGQSGQARRGCERRRRRVASISLKPEHARGDLGSGGGFAAIEEAGGRVTGLLGRGLDFSAGRRLSIQPGSRSVQRVAARYVAGGGSAFQTLNERPAQRRTGCYGNYPPGRAIRLRRGAVRPPGDRWLAGGRNSSRRHRWWRSRRLGFPSTTGTSDASRFCVGPSSASTRILFGMKRSWTTFSSARVSAAARSPTMTICFWLECAKSIAASSCGSAAGDRASRTDGAKRGVGSIAQLRPPGQLPPSPQVHRRD